MICMICIPIYTCIHTYIYIYVCVWEGQIGTISALAPPTPKNTETFVNLACPTSKTQIHSSIWHVQLHTRRNIRRFGMPNVYTRRSVRQFCMSKCTNAETFVNFACPNSQAPSANTGTLVILALGLYKYWLLIQLWNHSTACLKACLDTQRPTWQPRASLVNLPWLSSWMPPFGLIFLKTTLKHIMSSKPNASSNPSLAGNPKTA